MNDAKIWRASIADTKHKHRVPKWERADELWVANPHRDGQRPTGKSVIRFTETNLLRCESETGFIEEQGCYHELQEKERTHWSTGSPEIEESKHSNDSSLLL